MVTEAPPAEAASKDPQAAKPATKSPYLLRIQLPSEWQLSDEALLEISSLNDEWHFEADGEGGLLLVAPPGTESGERELEIAGQVRNWRHAVDRGRAYGSTLFQLPNGWRRAPDAAWVSDERLATVERTDELVWKVCPDFIIEVRSGTDELNLLMGKMEMWVDQGAREAWLVDPQEQTLTIYRPNQEPEQLERPESATATEIADDLSIDFARVWPEN